MVLDIQTVHHILFDFPFKNNFVFQEYLHEIFNVKHCQAITRITIPTQTNGQYTVIKLLTKNGMVHYANQMKFHMNYTISCDRLTRNLYTDTVCYRERVRYHVQHSK